MTKVTIYRFPVYDVGNDCMKTSGRWGIREAIETIRGVPLEDTGVEIDAPEWDHLDGLTAVGFDPYRRRSEFQTQVK